MTIAAAMNAIHKTIMSSSRLKPASEDVARRRARFRMLWHKRRSDADGDVMWGATLNKLSLIVSTGFNGVQVTKVFLVTCPLIDVDCVNFRHQGVSISVSGIKLL